MNCDVLPLAPPPVAFRSINILYSLFFRLKGISVYFCDKSVLFHLATPCFFLLIIKLFYFAVSCQNQFISNYLLGLCWLQLWLCSLTMLHTITLFIAINPRLQLQFLVHITPQNTVYSRPLLLSKLENGILLLRLQTPQCTMTPCAYTCMHAYRHINANTSIPVKNVTKRKYLWIEFFVPWPKKTFLRLVAKWNDHYQ